MDETLHLKPETGRPPDAGLNRRKALQLFAVAGVVGTVFYLSFGRNKQSKVVRHSQPMMGTIINMVVCGPDEAQCREAITACITRMESLSAMLSTYVPDSAISQLNRDGILRDAPKELLDVLALSRDLSELTNGAFDPTVMPLIGHYREVKKSGNLPGEDTIKEILKLVDYRHIVVEPSGTIRYTRPGTKATLDGIAKGYIVDQGIAVLREKGFIDTYVEAGGDLMTLGNRQDGKPWRIGIRNPRSNDLEKMDTIELSDRAIATSGDYMQYFTEDKKTHHIINPHTGFSPIDTASSSILAPTVAWADGLATATMVLGPRKSLELIETLPECEGYFIDKNLKKYQTKGFFS